MAKLTESIDVGAVLDRIVDAAELKNVSELAKKMGLTSQTLSQARDRKMLSLAFVLQAKKLTEKSLDYLIYGMESELRKDEEVENENKYLVIKRIGGGTVKVLAELLRRGIAASDLIAFVIEGRLYVIDTSDRVVTSGVFAFGDKERPAIRKCCQQIDGSVLVDGEANQQTEEDLSRYGIIGRVVLQQVGV